MKNVKLGVICNIEIGRTPSRNQPKYWGNGYSWLSIADMKNLKFLSDTKEQVTELAIGECNMKLVPLGTLLFSFKLSVGKVGIASKDLFTNEAIAALKIKSEKEVYQPFLYHALRSLNFDGKGDRAVKGITLNKAKLRELLIPLPPFPEQKRIAEILDKADALCRKNKQLMAAYDELLQATFLDMFGDATTNLKGWNRKMLNELVDDSIKYSLSSGPFGSSLTSVDYVDNGVPILRGLNVSSGYLDMTNVKYISELKARELIRSEVHPADIVIIAVGSSGKALMIPNSLKRAIMSQNFNKITVNQKIILPIFLEFSLNDRDVQEQIKRKMSDTVRTFFSLTNMKELQVICPPINLQNQFVKIVENIEAQKVLVKQSLQESEDLFNGLVQKAFSDGLQQII